MTTVGVTGGIGSGKSRLCTVWESLGARVVYADPLAKSCMVNDPHLRREIVKRFGPKAYREDGSLDRGWLAGEAFGKGRAEELNDIVHPVVRREMLRQMESARKEGRIPIFAEEAALLLLRGRPEEFDLIVVVTAPEESRKERVARRDGLALEEVESRMARQQSEDELIRMADIVLQNDGTIEDFDKRAKALFHTLQNLPDRASNRSIVQ